MSTSSQVVFGIFFAFAYLVSPMVLIWGWADGSGNQNSERQHPSCPWSVSLLLLFPPCLPCR